MTRNTEWRDEYSLFTSGLKVNAGNAKLFNNVGHALESQGKYSEALEYFHQAVRTQPDDIGAHINVGRTYNHMTMFEEAETAYLRAKSLLPRPKPGESYQARVAPNHLNVFLNLATLIAKNSSRLEEADLLYRQAISMRSDYTQAYINRGDILLKLNRTKEAQEVYERALFYDNTNADVYYNLGVVLLEQGRTSQALAYLNKALEFDPDHAQALLNSAMLIQESGSSHLRQLALERLHRIVAKGSLVNERVFFNLGMLSMDGQDLAGAETWFRRAVELKPDFRSALFNLALLLSDSDRPLEAAPFLHQLIRHHPNHTKGLILMGDIYINHLRDLDAAEACYRKILSAEPGNVQGLHNLCVVMVERGQLGQAKDCLARAHAIAPDEEYITRHLDIVVNKMAENEAGSNSVSPWSKILWSGIFCHQMSRLRGTNWTLFAFIVTLRAKRFASSKIVAIPLGLRTDDTGSDPPSSLKSRRKKLQRANQTRTAPARFFHSLGRNAGSLCAFLPAIASHIPILWI